MEGFLGGAMLALARKCEILCDELEKLPRKLPEGANAARAQDLARRRRAQMKREGSSARSQGMTVIRSKHGDHRARWLREYRSIAVQALHVEHHVLPFLRAFDEQAIALSDFAGRVGEAIKWPDRAPLVSPAATRYFACVPDKHDALIFAPRLAGRTLLPLPDLVHEMTHALLSIERFQHCLLGDWLEGGVIEARVGKQLTNASNYPDAVIEHWISAAVHEFTCDLVATYATGAAYAWQHLRGCAGRKEAHSVFQPAGRHPADDARFSAICKMLERLKLSDELEELQEAWAWIAGDDLGAEEMPGFYPPSAVDSLVESIHSGCAGLEIRAYSHSLASDDPCVELNRAWRELRNNPLAFDEVEREHPALFPVRLAR